MSWLITSNHWKHVSACFGISLIGGFIAGMVAGVAVEWTEKLCGNSFDWSDILADLIGSAVGGAINILIIYLIVKGGV
jgi:fructose-specific phosphotransferase system IIC component